MRARKHKRIELLILMFVPVSITFFMFILYVIPKHIWGLNHVMPLLPLIPIFYWGRSPAATMPFWFVFLTGLIMDVVGGTPLGLSALLYILLLAAWRGNSHHISNEGFIIIWVYFALSLAVYFVIELMMMSFTTNFWYIVPYSFMQWLLTISVYPLFHNLFDRLADYIKKRSRTVSHG